MAPSVAGDDDVYVDIFDYGSTYDEERVVPSGMMMEYPSSHPTWTTKKAGVVLLGLLGLTVSVASGGASLFFSSLVTSSEPARTEESFLLQARGGANDDRCVPASGPWPAGSVSGGQDDDTPNGHSGPYVTCFTFQGGEDQCWSHSYYDSGDWKPCTPNGFGVAGWSIDSNSDDSRNDDNSGFGGAGVGGFHIHLHPVETCGTACTRFSSDMPTTNTVYIN